MKNYVKGIRLPVGIGLRNMKTGLAVFACLLFYFFTEREGVMLAAVSAIICMQDNVEKSLASGLNRLSGTAIGAVQGMVFLTIANWIGIPWLKLALITLGIMLLILLCNQLKRNDAIAIACIVFLAITLAQSTSPFLYSVNRLLDTSIGVVAALAINRYIGNPDRRSRNEEGSETSGGGSNSNGGTP